MMVKSQAYSREIFSYRREIWRNARIKDPEALDTVLQL
jgi:hypothetical protein